MNDDLDYVYIAPDIVWRGARMGVEPRSELDMPATQLGRVDLPATFVIKHSPAKSQKIEIPKSLSRRLKHGRA